MVLVAAAVVDQLWTTLWVDGGAGPLSARLSSAVWQGFRTVGGPDRSRILSLAGPFVLVSTLGLLIGLIWAGWTSSRPRGSGRSRLRLDLPLDTLASQLDRLVDQHEAYPILHYYQPTGPDRAATVAVVVFDEAVTIIRCGVPEEYRPNGALLESARSSTREYLRTLDSSYVHPIDDAPPVPDLDRLRNAGVPTVSEEAFADALEDVEDVEDHRRELFGILEVAGWDWPPAEQ